jgi:hypothetical protein
MRTLGLCLALLALSSTAATAQSAAPAPAATPASAPAETPATAPAQTPAPAAAAQPAPAPEPAPSTTAAPDASAAPDATAPAAQDAALSETERQRREADRSRIRLLLARARAERAVLEQQAAQPNANAPAAQPEPRREPTPYRPGDAGAAIGVGLSLELPWHTGASFDLFSPDDVGERFGMWATHDLLALGPRAVLAAGLGFDVESLESKNLFAGALDTELNATVLYATGQARYALTDWLQPHARLSLGAQLIETEMSLNGTSYENDAEVPYGSLGAGITLRTPDRTFESRHNALASLSFGLMIEGGYTLAAPVEMSIDGPGPEDREIALIEPGLADLDRSGPYLRFSLVTRF